MEKRLVAVLCVLFTFFVSSQVFAITNDEIANTALLYIDQNGYTCKEFVQLKVLKSLGYSLGTGYRDCYSPEKNEVSETNALKGDIIQISNDANPKDDSHVHTAIVLDNIGNGSFKTVHSNWHLDEMVSIDTWNPSNYANKYPNYSAHFYRLGFVNLMSFDFPAHSSQGWNPGRDTERTKVMPDNDRAFELHVIGNNPGALSPMFYENGGFYKGDDLAAKNFAVMFSAKVWNNAFSSEGHVYFRDPSDNWHGKELTPGVERDCRQFPVMSK